MNIERILAATGEVPASLKREELHADLDGIRSFYQTGLELRSNSRRQQIARTLEAAKHLKQLITGAGILYWRFRPGLDCLIMELEKDCPPTVAVLLDINRGVSPFENVVRILADLFERHFDKKPGYSTSPLNDQVGGPFIRFAGAALAELGIYKEEDGSPYTPAAIKEALKKLRRVRV